MYMSVLRCCMYTKQTSVQKDLQKPLSPHDELGQSLHGESLHEESLEDEPAVVKEKVNVNEESVVVRCPLSNLLDIFCCKAPDKKVRFNDQPSIQ